MDHIQKIIQQLNSKNGAVQGSTSRNDKNISRVRTARTPGGLNTPVDKITYTQTEQISMGKHELDERRLIAGIMDDPRNTPFKILRTQVLHALKENNWTTIAINSATQGAGKSFVASNLAVSIALEVNYTVLLVDLDLRRPRVHKYFGIEQRTCK
jgi:Mrp family chromosome partitioning ATPase